MSPEQGPGPIKNDNELFNGDNWVLPSGIDIISKTVDAFDSKLEAAGWNSDERFDINLAFNEALANAMKHGNKFDENKKVFITLKIEKDKIYIKIRDEGNGFKPESVPVSTEGEGLYKGSGRGIHLMESLFNSVKYSDEGRTVEMVKEKIAV